MLDILGVDVTPQLEFALITRDKEGVKKYIREHDFNNMAKRNRSYHDRFRKELVKAQNDRKRGAEYKSKSGCDVVSQNNACNHTRLGCGGNSGHNTSRSKWCLYHKMKGLVLTAAIGTWTRAKTELLENGKEVIHKTDIDSGEGT